VIERLPGGLAGGLGEGGGLVSGGEGQRVRLARALLRPRVRLAILDEPFRGLEGDLRRGLLAVARQRWRSATLLYVSHDIDSALGFERVVVVDGGAGRRGRRAGGAARARGVAPGGAAGGPAGDGARAVGRAAVAPLVDGARGAARAMSEDLGHPSWAASAPGSAMQALVRAAGLTAAPFLADVRPDDAASLTECGARLGVEVVEVETTCGELMGMLRRLGPALLRIRVHGEERRLVVLRGGVRELKVLAPDGEVVRIGVQTGP
jgi:energy-coupling factor transporter ATP-binding protein EcfA2